MTRQLVPCFLVLCALPAASQAAILLDENFNELKPQNNAVDLGELKAVAGVPDSVDIVSGAECPAPESGNCVELNGAGFGRLESKITVSPGKYFLSFDLINAPGVTTNTTVSLGDTRLAIKLGPGDTTDIVLNQLVTVDTIGSPRLFIASNTFGRVGALLDNVIISTTPLVGAPEPATFGLLALGIAGAGLCARRRR